MIWKNTTLYVIAGNRMAMAHARHACRMQLCTLNPHAAPTRTICVGNGLRADHVCTYALVWKARTRTYITQQSVSMSLRCWMDRMHYVLYLSQHGTSSILEAHAYVHS